MRVKLQLVMCNDQGGQFQVPDDSSLKLYSSPLMVDVV